MKTKAAFALFFSCFLQLSQARTQQSEPKPAEYWFRGYGFEKLPEVVQWIRQFDAEWDKLVKKEERAQMLRQVGRIASATAELKLHCDEAVTLLSKGADVIPEIDALKETVHRLRYRMADLSTNLGGGVGNDGLAIAEQFDNFMQTRDTALSNAHRALERVRPEDRAEATEYLKKAAVLARDAHEALVGFIYRHQEND